MVNTRTLTLGVYETETLTFMYEIPDDGNFLMYVSTSDGESGMRVTVMNDSDESGREGGSSLSLPSLTQSSLQRVGDGPRSGRDTNELLPLPVFSL